MKTIELNPIINNKFITVPIGLLLIYAGVYSGVISGNFTTANIIYTVVGIVSVVFSFEREIFGNYRYVKYYNNELIYKRTPLSKNQKINTNEVSEIKFHGSKIYINSENKVIIINIDLIKMKSRKELRDFFTENFKEKVIFSEQDNIFVERYERKLKKIEERQKLKNDQ